ncbi:hypothetical protein AC249_AIPGENE15054 [Exaiptasia diaphana]|nr:hypothetical protein AC249_AIPGENE15054 [Exaiptasia diaphana]
MISILMSVFVEPPIKLGSIEVGLVIMGMSCICVVACALIFLQLRSIRKQRQQRRRRERASIVSITVCNNEGIASAAPPSYETVLRNPHLYPISPRSSIVSVNSTKSLRRASEASGHSSNARPDGNSSSGALSQSYCTLQLEDLEEPPPPFPGIVNNGFIDPHLERTYYDDMDTVTYGNHGSRERNQRLSQVEPRDLPYLQTSRNRSVSDICASTSRSASLNNSERPFLK